MVRRRREYFRISQFRRTYDRAENKFLVNIAYETAAPKPSERVVAVAEGFGLGLDKWEKFVVYDNLELKVSPRDVVYISGDSGSGKSVLLHAVKEDLGEDAVDVADVQVDVDRPLVETVGSSVEEAIELLSRVGLNDAFLFLRSYRQLSDGQRYRYRIAKLLESSRDWWILDEFAATLDRDTAKIVSFNLQKIARLEGKCVIAATTHTDLLEDLKPSVHIHKRYGKEIAVKYYPNMPAPECSLLREMRVEEGTTKDWRELAAFHYRSHRIAAPRKIFCLKRGDELCGVIVYCYPPSTSYGRRLVLPRMSMKELNEKLSVISRVVVHPKYRTIGLGSKLVRDTLELASTEYVEMSAVMAKYNPFAEKAGMAKIAEQHPPREALNILKVLKKLGFDGQLLSSEAYVKRRLEALTDSGILEIKEIFSRQRHTRFMKSFSYHLPFGTKDAYVKEIMAADLNKLANLIKICGFLMQTKVYLFWRKLSL
jgi:ABC-type lipoprotein export system ATPase subunit/GNAT superfamily N-acetyltransferase